MRWTPTARQTYRRKRTAKSCGPDVAVLASSRRDAKVFAGDGGKRAVLRGEHEASRKAIAQGRPGCSACTCMLVCKLLPMRRRHAGPRVREAPGLPCALNWTRAGRYLQTSGEIGREIATLYPRHCERSEAIQCYSIRGKARITRCARNELKGRRSARRRVLRAAVDIVPGNIEHAGVGSSSDIRGGGASTTGSRTSLVAP